MSKQKKSQKDKYKAIIIGAGQIASGFDSPKSKEILTHAHAYTKHPKVNLIGFFDINKKTSQKAARKWNCQSFDNLEKMLKKIHPDIISVCTPNKTHYNILLKLAKHKPKIVVCEKPITARLKDAQKIVNLYKKNIPMLVNYSRRFDSTVQKIQQDIKKKNYGKVLSSSGIYTKGILNNGSHMIDLCRFLFGEVKKAKSTNTLSDYSNEDKSVAGFLKFEKCKQFHLITGDERRYSIFELDIMLEKARIRFINFGFNVSAQKLVDDPLYLGYKCLNRPIINKTSLDKAMFNLIDNAVNYLTHKKQLLCSVEDALKTQKVCEKLLCQN